MYFCNSCPGVVFVLSLISGLLILWLILRFEQVSPWGPSLPSFALSLFGRAFVHILRESQLFPSKAPSREKCFSQIHLKIKTMPSGMPPLLLLSYIKNRAVYRISDAIESVTELLGANIAFLMIFKKKHLALHLTPSMIPPGRCGGSGLYCFIKS